VVSLAGDEPAQKRRDHPREKMGAGATVPCNCGRAVRECHDREFCRVARKGEGGTGRDTVGRGRP